MVYGVMGGNGTLKRVKCPQIFNVLTSKFGVQKFVEKCLASLKMYIFISTYTWSLDFLPLDHSSKITDLFFSL